MAARTLRIFFLIRDLNLGGAQRQLVLLANGLVARGHAVAVAVFYGGGELEGDLRGVEFLDLGKRGRWDLAGFFHRLAAAARRFRPDVLHGYLGTANLLTVALRPLIPGVHVVWGLRASELELRRYDPAWRFSSRLEGLCSPLADRIVANSRAGLAAATRRGFPRERLVHVPNGVDGAVFVPDRERGAALRREWTAGGARTLVGLAGRLDPMKDHETFLHAAALARRERPDLGFVCVGGGWEGPGARLRELGRELGLESALVWAGPRADMPAVYNALDLLCLSSVSEGFPNVVAEAMSCGLPCVVTDVGDAAGIVGDLGVVTPPRAPKALADGLLALVGHLEREGGALRERVRARVLERFGVEALVERTETLLRELATRRP